MPYDKSKYRSIRHGLDGQSAFCRHCNKRWYDNDVKKAIYHAKTTGHTVDVYREHWTEYTSYVKATTPNKPLTINKPIGLK